MVLSCRSRKVHSYLVRTKVYRPKWILFSFKYKSRFQGCLNLNKKNTFANTVTKKTNKNRHKFNCNNKCLNPYITKAVGLFCFRCNIYKNYSRNYDCYQSCMYVSITLIGKTYVRYTLCAMAPNGLNVEGSV